MYILTYIHKRTNTHTGQDGNDPAPSTNHARDYRGTSHPTSPPIQPSQQANNAAPQQPHEASTTPGARAATAQHKADTEPVTQATSPSEPQPRILCTTLPRKSEDAFLQAFVPAHEQSPAEAEDLYMKSMNPQGGSSQPVTASYTSLVTSGTQQAAPGHDQGQEGTDNDAKIAPKVTQDTLNRPDAVQDRRTDTDKPDLYSSTGARAVSPFKHVFLRPPSPPQAYTPQAPDLSLYASYTGKRGDLCVG